MTEQEMYDNIIELANKIVIDADTQEEMLEIDRQIEEYAKKNNIPEWIVDRAYIETGAGSFLSMQP